MADNFKCSADICAADRDELDAYVAQFNCRAEVIEWIGPAGGNPYVNVIADKLEDIESFVNEHYWHDGGMDIHTVGDDGVVRYTPN